MACLIESDESKITFHFENATERELKMCASCSEYCQIDDGVYSCMKAYRQLLGMGDNDENR